MADLADPLIRMAMVIGLLGAAAALAAFAGRRALIVVYPACLAASALAIVTDLGVLFANTTATAHLPIGLPTIGLHFRLDALSGFFGLVVNLGVAASALYGLGLDRQADLSPRIEPFFPLFALAMNGVVLADDAFGFLFFWELMSVSSWALVLAQHEDAEARQAAHVYLVMASIGTIALLFAFGGMAGPAGGYDFATIRAAQLDPLIAVLVLVAVLIGTGSKAGVIPLHAWLPLAHPAAPSHVSALMSGVMTKVAVYGLVRVLFDLVGTPHLWAGALILIVGAASTLMGVLYALMQHDLKRLLAYHTVENIGIIFIGIGLAVAFRANAMPALAALSLTAALFHVFNHSLFKALLFLGSGAVLHATGLRDLERMGGLIHRMPATALAFLIGCVAISALPPLNGFASEWLTFQAILQSPNLPQLPLKILVPTVGAMLALSAALAAACFVKAFGIAFLGRPRSDAARSAHETNHAALASMGFFAALCVVAGLLPGLIIDALASVNQSLLNQQMPQQMSVPWLSIVPIGQSTSSYNALLIAAFILMAGGVTALIVRRIATHAIRRAPAWDCGFPDPSPATQYTAGSFAQPIRRVYGTVVFSARDHVIMPAPGSAEPARFAVSIRDHIWNLAYAAPARQVVNLSARLNVFQFLTIRRYLILMFVALVILLVAVTLEL
jgi:hydrogenase-4 component B